MILTFFVIWTPSCWCDGCTLSYIYWYCYNWFVVPNSSILSGWLLRIIYTNSAISLTFLGIMVVHNNNRVFKRYCWITIMKQHKDCWKIILMHIKNFCNTIHHLSLPLSITKITGMFAIFLYKTKIIGGPQQQGIQALLLDNNVEKTSGLLENHPYAYEKLL